MARKRPLRLKPVRSISEEEALHDIKQRYIKHPLFQARVRVSPSEASGSAVLAWHRGHHAGVHSAYLTLRKRYPEAAEALLAAFNMSKQGDLGLER